MIDHRKQLDGAEVNGISISVSISTIVGTLDLAIDIKYLSILISIFLVTPFFPFL